MRFARAVVKSRVAILIIAALLLACSVMGIARTRINYDMLDYLPEDMDTVMPNRNRHSPPTISRILNMST